MNEVFVLERMLTPGVWELVYDEFYPDNQSALDAQSSYDTKMREVFKKINKPLFTRVKKLKRRQ